MIEPAPRLGGIVEIEIALIHACMVERTNCEALRHCEVVPPKELVTHKDIVPTCGHIDRYAGPVDAIDKWIQRHTPPRLLTIRRNAIPKGVALTAQIQPLAHRGAPALSSRWAAAPAKKLANALL